MKTLVSACVLALLAGPALAVHGPHSASDGLTPGGTTADNKAQPAGRDPGENGDIARGAEKGNPNDDGLNDVIDNQDGGGLFPDQAGGFPGGRKK